MRYFKDRDRNARVCILDSLEELIAPSVELFQKNGDIRGRRSGVVGGEWEGRRFANLESFATAIRRPWEEGMNLVEEYRRSLAQDLPEPTSRIRRNKWNESVGALDVARLLAGDPVMYRSPERVRAVAPANVALVAHIGGNGSQSAEALGWRGAATVATTDLLESAGYNCEVWLWDLSSRQFRGECQDWFLAAKVKACGDPFDPDLLISGMSSWYFRLVDIQCRQHKMFGGDSYGYGMASTRVTKLSATGLSHHLDLVGDITKIELDAPHSRDGALVMARKALQQATSNSDQQQ